jgi:hypothetical protein
MKPKRCKKYDHSKLLYAYTSLHGVNLSLGLACIFIEGEGKKTYDKRETKIKRRMGRRRWWTRKRRKWRRRKKKGEYEDDNDKGDREGKSHPCNRPRRPTGLWDVETPTFSRQSAHRWRWCQPYAPAALYPQEDSWYSFQLEVESTLGPYYGWK